MLSYRSKRIISTVALIFVCALYVGKVAKYSNNDNLEAFAATGSEYVMNTVQYTPAKDNTTTNIEANGPTIEESSEFVESNTNQIVSEETTELESIEEPIPVYIEFSEDEIYELATLVYLESGTEPYECQLAIASVVINRMNTTGQSLKEVIYAKNQFSPAYLIESSEPNESTLNAVREVVQNGPTVPEYVTFFRADYYHDWSDLIIPYCVYGNTYFSADVRLMGE